MTSLPQRPFTRAVPERRHNLAAPDRHDKQEDAGRGAEQKGDQRGLKAEAAAGQQFRPVDPWVDQAQFRPGARHGAGEYAGLRIVPRQMEADGQPQAARQHEGGGEQHPGLDRDEQGTLKRSIGIREMPQTEEQGCHGQRDPASQVFFEDAEEDAAMHQFLEYG